MPNFNVPFLIVTMSTWDILMTSADPRGCILKLQTDPREPSALLPLLPPASETSTQGSEPTTADRGQRPCPPLGTPVIQAHSKVGRLGVEGAGKGIYDFLSSGAAAMTTSEHGLHL